MQQHNEAVLFKEWLWVKQVAELCERVRSQFEVSAARCGVLLRGPSNFQEELEKIWSEITERQRAVLTQRLEDPNEIELQLISSSKDEERIINTMGCLRVLASKGDVCAKEVLITLIATFPELGDPSDRAYPFDFNLKAIGHLAECLDARKNMLLVHELRRMFLVAVARSLCLDPQAPAFRERPERNAISLFIANGGSSALVPQFRWYAGYVETVRRSRCTLRLCHRLTYQNTIVAENGSLDVAINGFVTGKVTPIGRLGSVRCDSGVED
jgi:hypothetical protein